MNEVPTLQISPKAAPTCPWICTFKGTVMPHLWAHSPGLLGKWTPGLISKGSSPHPCPGPHPVLEPLWSKTKQEVVT